MRFPKEVECAREQDCRGSGLGNRLNARWIQVLKVVHGECPETGGQLRCTKVGKLFRVTFYWQTVLLRGSENPLALCLCNKVVCASCGIT